MKQNFIFAFVLLATLLMVNVAPYKLNKRETKFVNCTRDEDKPALLGVTINPDPIIRGKDFTGTIFGKLPVDIPETAMEWVTFFDKDFKQISFNFYERFCWLKGSRCPVEAGTSFSVEIKGVFAPKSNDVAYLRFLLQDKDEEPNVDIACAISENIIVL